MWSPQSCLLLVTIMQMSSCLQRPVRSPDGGRISFTGRQGRSGGRGPSASQCDNSGWRCGQPSIAATRTHGDRVPKVRGGKCSQSGAVPWTVQLQVKERGRYRHRCGGSLLSDRFVLTAAHCFGGIVDKDILVILGQDNITSTEDPGEVAFQVEKYWIHEEFQAQGPYSHDIALLRLQTKGDGCGARFTRTVSPICLPEPWTSFPQDTECLVSGWGKTKPHDRIHGECLRAAQLPLMSDSECSAAYSSSSQTIIPEMLCAGYKEGGVDACKGDSGGPLVCRDKHNSDNFILAGVVSWGLGCGKADTPGVFTEVIHYLDWIQKRIDAEA